MKCTRSFIIGVMSFLLLGTLPQGAFAASVQQSTSTATVQFNQPSSGQEPLLKLDYAPDLHFGTKDFSLSNQTYKASDLTPYVQVTDQRGFSLASGWKVTVAASPFVSTTSSSTLKGAIITFAKGESTEVTNFGFGPPTPENTITLSTDNKITNVVSALAGDGRGTWKTSWLPTPPAEGQPQPTENDNVTLSVAGGSMNYGESYTSQLTWTLENTP